VIIMIGATFLTMAYMSIAMGLPPLVIGLLAAYVAYGRWRIAPLGASRLGAQNASFSS
jgi:hypothetical protein